MSVKTAGVAIIAVAFTMVATMAWAQPRQGSREDVLDNLVRRMQLCGEAVDATRRLQCYDEIGRSMGSNPPPGAPQNIPRADSTQPYAPTPLAPPPGGVATNPPVIGAPPGSGDSSVNPTPYADRAYNPNDPRDPRSGIDAYPPPPQPQVRRTGPQPLSARPGVLPVVGLQTSQFGYNEQRYWQISIDLSNNIGRLIDAEIQCTFTNNGRPVKESYFTATAVAPGEHVMTEVIGPPTTVFTDGVTCRVLSPLR